MDSVYICYLVPVLVSLVLVFFYRKRIVWWEIVILLVVSSLFILLGKWMAINSLTSDIEYLGGYVNETRYYEDWNEYIHRTCTRCSGSGKFRSCTIYDCSYVKYHPEYWTAETTIGSYNIARAEFDKLVTQFRVPKVFYDMKRHYFSDDGDMYYAKWKGDNETIEPVTGSETYENRPKASLNVFHFIPPDTSELKKYKPFDYPGIRNYWDQTSILGYEDAMAEKKLQILNARLGGSKQVRVYILVFKDTDKQAGPIQERYWQGANKNEFIICIGIDKNKNVQWTYEFSWTEKAETKVETRVFIEEMKVLDLEKVVDFTYSEMQEKWKRRDFHEFDYIHIEPTIGQIIWICVLNLLLCSGIAWWVVVNEFD